MPIKLPDFRETRCQGVEACALVVSGSDALMEILEKLDGMEGPPELEKELTATYGAKAPNRVVLEVGGDDPRHFHIEAFNRKRLGSFEEEVNTTALKKPLVKIQGYMDLLLGAEVEVNLTAFFPLPLQLFEDQCSLAAVFYNLERDDVVFRSRQMALDFDEGPIDRVAWRLLDDDESVVVRVDATLAGAVDENYLTAFVDYFDGFFRAILMGEERPK